MLDNQSSPAKELDAQKEVNLSDKLLPCRKCGMLDYDFWDGKGTQAYLTCNECGQEENIQVTDLYESVDEWPKFSQRTISYPCYAVEKTNKALMQNGTPAHHPRNSPPPSKRLIALMKKLGQPKLYMQ